MSKFKKIIIGLLILLITIPLIGFGYVYSKLNKIYVKDEVIKNEEAKEEGNIVEGITNILLVGTDGNRVDQGNRSDSMMLVTIDSNINEIKISTIARDTYVEIPGYGHEKLTHAYAYQGIDLLREVFEINFDIDVDKYIAVNFPSFMHIMDELGGVEVQVNEKDIDEINKYIDGCYDYYSEEEKANIEKEYITEAGLQRLNGYQALAFSRIRYTDSAFHRQNRHKEVAESVYREALTKGPDEYKRCADILLDNTKTNISPMEMLDLGFTVLKIADTDIEQFEFPLADHRDGKILSKETGWVLTWDREPNLKAWHEFIFNTSKDSDTEDSNDTDGE